MGPSTRLVGLVLPAVTILACTVPEYAVVEGAAKCSSALVNVATDPVNCGYCGHACPKGGTCERGSCACPESTTECDGACRDLDSDGENCGTCGSACPSDQRCAQGRCSCASGTQCDGTCVDLATTEEHCGSCDVACGERASCGSGTCRCKSQYEECGDVCSTLTDDDDNCGACGVRCDAQKPGSNCANAKCACTGASKECTPGSCTDTSTSKAHCGACNAPCGGDCLGGECCAAPPGGGACTIFPLCGCFSAGFNCTRSSPSAPETCVPAGAAPIGGTCMTEADCVRGATCATFNAEPSALCRKTCGTNADCPAASPICRQLNQSNQPIVGLKACFPG